MRDRLLFILKERESYWGGSPIECPVPSYGSSGLTNSVSFIIEMLEQNGIEAKMVQVADNNAIDREVTAYRPTHVVIEAYWVVPEKFDVLKPLHPMVQWIVRNHSELPFLAMEGIAMEWTAGYLRRGVEVMSNSRRAQSDLQQLARAWGINDRLLTYGPNYYPVQRYGCHVGSRGGIDIGCFGAIRPLKNHLTQAMAAVTFGRLRRERLRFHINATRIEGRADPILKNLQALFAACQHAELVEHPWMSHKDFLGLVKTMDAVMQVSFSETFNIVSADAVNTSVPVVVSSEVPWIGDYAQADPTDPRSMVRILDQIWDEPLPRRLGRQWRDLSAYDVQTEAIWTKRFQ
jgi:hypothetical protein